MKLLIFVFSIIASAYAHVEAQTESTVTPLILTDKNTKGFELRGQAGALIEMVKAKKFVEAEQLAARLRISYEIQFNKHLKQYTFQSEDEYNEFEKVSSDQFE